MNTFSLRDYLFKDRPGDNFGERAEVIVTLMLGFLSTAVAIFTYRNPVVLLVSMITNTIAVFTLIQALRGKYQRLILFPLFTAVAICIATILEGKGVHDLVWMGGLGLFLLVNIYSRRNITPVFLFGFFIVALFAGSGFAEINNLLPNPYGTDARYVLLNSFFFITIMAAIAVVFHRHRTLLKNAVQNQIELIKSSEDLKTAKQSLEELVDSQTVKLNELNQQIQVRVARLQAAAEISQSLMSGVNEKPNDMLMRVTKLISEKLGYYHVGIFLLDDSREFAVLRAANSKGGQQMLVRRHQLKVGGAGIVGYVAQSGRPRIALDTGADAVFFNNPDLPETHSEISLPLKIANTTIGVLDVQSTQASAFNEEDMNTLMTIANQITITLRYSQESSAPIQSRRQAQDFRTSGREKQSGYTFRPDGSLIENVSQEANPLTEKAIVSGETVIVSQPSKGSRPSLAVPVKFREQVIGYIHIESAEVDRAWTEDEIALVQTISDRAALALENARLFEDATRRAAQEQTISRVTTQIGASTDFDRILQTTIQELGLALGASRSFIQLGTTPSEGTLG